MLFTAARVAQRVGHGALLCVFCALFSVGCGNGDDKPASDENGEEKPGSNAEAVSPRIGGPTLDGYADFKWGASRDMVFRKLEDQYGDGNVLKTKDGCIQVIDALIARINRSNSGGKIETVYFFDKDSKLESVIVAYDKKLNKAIIERFKTRYGQPKLLTAADILRVLWIDEAGALALDISSRKTLAQYRARGAHDRLARKESYFRPYKQAPTAKDIQF